MIDGFSNLGQAVSPVIPHERLLFHQVEPSSQLFNLRDSVVALAADNFELFNRATKIVAEVANAIEHARLAKCGADVAGDLFESSPIDHQFASQIH